MNTSQHIWNLARPVSALWRYLQPSRVQIAARNLQLAFPHLRGNDLQTLLIANFHHLAATPIELVASHNATPSIRDDCTINFPHAGTVTTHHRRHLSNILHTHQRALILTAHLGNFELALLAEALHGVPITVLTKTLSNPTLNALWHSRRRRHNIELLPDDKSLSQLLTALQNRRVVVMTLDQHANREHSVTVPFFQRPAHTHRSLALIALRTQTPIIPAFALRTAPGQHTLTYHPPIHLTSDASISPRTLITQHTRTLTAALERVIQQHPEQWTWLHRRWKSHPSQRRTKRMK